MEWQERPDHAQNIDDVEQLLSLKTKFDASSKEYKVNVLKAEEAEYCMQTLARNDQVQVLRGQTADEWAAALEVAETSLAALETALNQLILEYNTLGRGFCRRVYGQEDAFGLPGVLTAIYKLELPPTWKQDLTRGQQDKYRKKGESKARAVLPEEGMTQHVLSTVWRTVEIRAGLREDGDYGPSWDPLEVPVPLQPLEFPSEPMVP